MTCTRGGLCVHCWHFTCSERGENGNLWTKFKVLLSKTKPLLQKCGRQPWKKWKHVQSKFSITCPNKIHIMCQHIPEFIEKKKLALGKTSDQLIENTHQHTNKIFSRSCYYVKNVNSPAHKSKLERGLAQYNSYNVWCYCLVTNKHC